MQELERLHHDTRAHATSLLKHCAELKSAAEASQAARQVDTQSSSMQWEAHMRHMEIEQRAVTDGLKTQLAEMAEQLRSASEQSAEATQAMEALQQGKDSQIHSLENQIAASEYRLEECKAAHKKASQLAEAQEHEIHMLHEQVCSKLQSSIPGHRCKRHVDLL